MDFVKELELYKKQQEQIKELFIKLQGRIQMCEEIIENEKKDKK